MSYQIEWLPKSAESPALAEALEAVLQHEPAPHAFADWQAARKALDAARQPLTYTPTELAAAFQSMIRTGGEFASSLAEAWFAGDSANRARIQAAFPELLERYYLQARDAGTL